jgi:hypothetical protein
MEVTFDVYEDFMNYQSGVYQHQTGDYLGGHAVLLIGVNFFLFLFFLRLGY